LQASRGRPQGSTKSSAADSTPKAPRVRSWGNKPHKRAAAKPERTMRQRKTANKAAQVHPVHTKRCGQPTPAVTHAGARRPARRHKPTKPNALPRMLQELCFANIMQNAIAELAQIKTVSSDEYTSWRAPDVTTPLGPGQEANLSQPPLEYANMRRGENSCSKTPSKVPTRSTGSGQVERKLSAYLTLLLDG
jgi:hypothetical protein